MRLSQLTNSQMHYGSAENLLGKRALCSYESFVTKQTIDSIAAQRFPNSEAVETIVKTAQHPAMSNAPGYARELTRLAYGELIDQLRPVAILPQCTPAAQQHSFNGAGAIYLPKRVGGSAAGAFRAEGGPITVKGLMFGHALLTAKNLGVILTATEEMLHRSPIDLAAYFQNKSCSAR